MTARYWNLVAAGFFGLLALLPNLPLGARIICGVVGVGILLFTAIAEQLDATAVDQKASHDRTENLQAHAKTHASIDELNLTLRNQAASRRTEELRKKALEMADEIQTWYYDLLKEKPTPPRIGPIIANAAVFWANRDSDGLRDPHEMDTSREFLSKFRDRFEHLRDEFAGLHLRDSETETIYASVTGGYSSRVIFVVINGLRRLAERLPAECK